MDQVKKKVWVKPVLKKIEPTPELLSRFEIFEVEVEAPRLRRVK